MSKGETKKREKTWFALKEFYNDPKSRGIVMFGREMVEDLNLYVEVRLVEVRKKKARGK